MDASEENKSLNNEDQEEEKVMQIEPDQAMRNLAMEN